MSTPAFDPYRALEVLTKHGVRFIVIGAFSAVTQGYPLPTQDLDVTPTRDPENLERLAEALRELHAQPRLPRDETLPFVLDATYLARANSWTLSTDAGPLDIIFEPAGTAGFQDLNRDAIDETIRGIQVRLASLRDVIRMKETSNRLKDQAQLPALRETLEVIRRRERE